MWNWHATSCFAGGSGTKREKSDARCCFRAGYGRPAPARHSSGAGTRKIPGLASGRGFRDCRAGGPHRFERPRRVQVTGNHPLRWVIGGARVKKCLRSVQARDSPTPNREDRGIGGPFVPRTRIAVLNRCGWKLPAARWVTTWYCLSSSLPSKQSEFDPPKGTTEPAVVGSGITWRPVGPLAGKVKRNLQDKVPGALADLERSRDAVATAMVRSASGRSTRLCSTLSSRMLSSLLQQVRL